MPPKEQKSTIGVVRYLKRPPPGQQLFTYLYEVPVGVAQPSNLELIDTEVSLTDVHSVNPQPSLERNGIKLVQFGLPLKWDSDSQIQTKVIPLVEDMLKRETGAARVVVCDHTVRRGTIEVPSVASVTGHGKPVARVHVDYTANSARVKLTALLPQEAEKLMEHPWAIVQVWKPLIGPVQQSPLGLIDAATVQPQDLLPYSLHFPGKGGDTIGVNGGGESYAVLHNPCHRWLYAKDMSADEAYLFLSFDSRGDGRPRFTPHTGFIDTATLPDAKPRQSIEFRTFCFWEA